MLQLLLLALTTRFLILMTTNWLTLKCYGTPSVLLVPSWVPVTLETDARTGHSTHTRMGIPECLPTQDHLTDTRSSRYTQVENMCSIILPLHPSTLFLRRQASRVTMQVHLAAGPARSNVQTQASAVGRVQEGGLQPGHGHAMNAHLQGQRYRPRLQQRQLVNRRALPC
jgi:hypothetical protein